VSARRGDLIELLAKVEAGEWDNHGTSWLFSNDRRHAFSAFHGDLNAAKALHEAVLPGWGWSYYSDDGHFLVGHPTDGKIYEETHNDTPARAWLIAILKALIAEAQPAPPPTQEESANG
jgi:hypothetical protein